MNNDPAESEAVKSYQSDSDAFLELKKRYGIRNRFWRKNYKRLKPGLQRLYQEALVSRYRPLTLAVIEAHTLPASERQAYYRLRFTELLQESRRLGSVYLRPNQKCQLPRQRNKNDERTIPVVLDEDGSPSLEWSEQVRAYFERGAELLEQQLTPEAIQERLKAMIARFEEPPEGAPILRMMNSSWMRLLSQLVPGFPLIGVILTEMDGQQGMDWKQLGNRLIGRAAREGANAGLRRVLHSLRAPGAFLPVSFLLDQGMNRAELLGYLSMRVERKKQQLLDIALPKKHL
ncbi:MAG: hypothetical protein KDK33_11660 [Leptospiraceae bacterium]|nr:hypothetical protein [Leptospiraceae bacterium]